MSGMTKKEREFAGNLIEALDLEDVAPEDIKPDAPLFGYGHEQSLGLDSIDALEISLMIAQKYNVQLKADDGDNEKIFASLRALLAHVEELSAQA